MSLRHTLRSMQTKLIQTYQQQGPSGLAKIIFQRLHAILTMLRPVHQLRMAVRRVRHGLNGRLPLPPASLLRAVAGTDDIDWFLKSGAMAAQSMREILEKNGLTIENFNAILDFGCGSGRVMRHWKELTGPILYGQDYNPKLVAWCQRNLTFARFQVNPLEGRLEYQDGVFDFIYALSVFTHLTASRQAFWMQELSRVLRPGGYLFFTTHGDFYLPQLSLESQARFRNGEVVVYGSEREGSNICTVFHPERYVRETLARNLDVIDFVPEGARGNPRQDVYLLQKPAPPLGGHPVGTSGYTVDSAGRIAG